MRPTSAAKHSSVVSLLTQGYPHCQIHAKTGVSLGNISKIEKELDSNKENNYGGCPSKLSAHDKQSIIRQINSGKLNNAVQATQFINNTLTNPVYSQTVRNALKEAGLWSATKKKVPMLKQTHQQRQLKFAHYHKSWTVENWKRVLWSDETKINWIGSDGKVYVWKQQGELVSDHIIIPTVKHGGDNNIMVWGCMG
jgi:transposase